MTVKTLDRRWIFLFIFLGVALPLIFHLNLKIKSSENTRLVYELVEKTPANSVVLISYDYDPASEPELHPMAKALTRHCLSKGHRIIAVALWPQGVSMAEDIRTQLEEDINFEYGKNYVNLGYKAGGIVTIQAMGKNMKAIFPTDMNRTPVDELELMKDVNDFSDIAFVFSLSSGDPGIKQYVMVAKDRYGVPTSGGTTAVSTPSILPYVNEQRQLYGLLGGLKSAAEYEQMINSPGTATSGMDAQSVAHLIIIIFIVIGNINYWLQKKNIRKE